MKFVILCFSAGTLFGGCFLLVPHEATKKEVFNAARYDKKILDNFQKYSSLAQTLLTNLDTIFQYKDSTNLVIFSTKHGDSTAPKPEVCYTFLNIENKYYDINTNTVPVFLVAKVDSLWNAVDKPEIVICKENRPATISIRIQCLERKNNILECHFLYWGLTNFDNNDSFDFVKDTSLSKDCIYRIGVSTDYSGW